MPGISNSQERSEVINKIIRVEQSPSNTVLLIANISGGIQIVEGNQEEIKFSVTKRIEGKTEERLLEGWENTILHFDDRKDTILVYIETPCQRFNHIEKNQKWNYDWNGSECHEKWKYNFDFIVTIPKQLNLKISTVNNGKIEVEGISGTVKANNVNGAIKVSGASKAIHLYTINGNVDVEYSAIPTAESSYYTLNGDINAFFPEGLSADIYFKSFNGDFFTNINEITTKPIVVKETTPKEKGVAFKIGTKSNIQARSGGVLLNFETFNGNVYVKEKSK